MAGAIDNELRKFHASLNVTDLNRSIEQTAWQLRRVLKRSGIPIVRITYDTLIEGDTLV